MDKVYKITLTLIAEISDEAKEFYDKSPPDLHEAIATSDNAKLTMEETTEQPQEKW